MRVLVTGSGGFIGGHLVGRLLNQGHDVRAVDIRPLDDWWQVHEAHNLVLDLRDMDSAVEAVKSMEWVYDLAEDMGGVGWLENNRADGLVSFRIIINLVEAAEKEGIERFWFSSSACAYNTDLQRQEDVRPLKESDAIPARPEEGYGEAKWMGERLCEYFRREGRLETRLGRYHNIYGPHGSWDGGREKSPAAICRKVAQAVVLGCNEIEIWGDGEQRRSYCYIEDCLDGTIRLMESNITQPLNIGSAELVSINQLVDLVEDIAGVGLQRHYNLTAPQGVRGRSSDNTLIKQLLDWEPSTPLREGLGETYDWVLAQVKKHHGST